MPVGGPRGKVTRRVTRIKQPQRAKKVTTTAKGASFAALTHHLGTGQKAATPIINDPFAGPNAAALRTKYAHYDLQAQAWIARALKDKWVQSKMSGNTGTAPELVVVGRFLAHGYKMHVNLFFQEVALRLFRHFNRTFIADVAIRAPGGGLILMPIDGHFFHSRTLAQELDAAARDRALGSLGKVVAVPDVECMSGTRLDAFLLRHQVP